ncbi:unnamed protein product, partial [Rotaria socialis]
MSAIKTVGYGLCKNVNESSVTTTEKHHNGVAMGAPLAPIIADVFMTNLETTLMDDLINAGVSEWHQYVD